MLNLTAMTPSLNCFLFLFCILAYDGDSVTVEELMAMNLDAIHEGTKVHHHNDGPDTEHNHPRNDHELMWTLKVSTGRVPGAGTDSVMKIVLQGQLGNSSDLALRFTEPYSLHEGNLATLEFLTADIGEPLVGIVIDHSENTGYWGAWFPNKVELVSELSGVRYEVFINQWLDQEGVENGKRYFPVSQVMRDYKLHASSFKCSVCHSIVSIAMEIIASGRDEAEDQVATYCNDILFLRKICKSIVKQVLDRIMEALERNVPPQRICNEVVHMCDAPVATRALNEQDIKIFANYHQGPRWYMPSRSRFAVLNPVTDGDVLPTDAILAVDMNMARLSAIFSDNEKGMKWLTQYRLLANTMLCPNLAGGPLRCGDGMTLLKDTGEIDKFIWRCKTCRRELEGVPNAICKQSIRHGSFFDNAHLSLLQIVQLMYLWSNSPTLKIEQIKQETGITGEQTVVDWYNFFRDVCQDWCRDNLMAGQQLGGPNIILEIDESKFFLAKHNRGRMPNRNYDWVFGLIERGSNRVIMVEVPRRDAATLLPIIQQHCRPGTRVISDGWAVYGGISALQQAYDHDWVNHRINFVDPTDPTIHTQTIEAMWGGIKRSLKHLSGTIRPLFETYLYQYMFRRAHDNRKIFQHLLRAVAHYYPV